MEKHAKWAIAAIVSWIFFFVILFGGVIHKTALVKEYGCTVEKFEVDPRFDFQTKCSILPGNDILSANDAIELARILGDAKDIESYNGRRGEPEDRQPHCEDLEKQTSRWYSPKLCMHAKWGFEDPLCPPESATCYSGHNWHRKCQLYSPLAYNITVGLKVDHLGYMEKNRDLGTDKDRYDSYKTDYEVGKRMTCQVVKGTGNDVKWIDERMSHTAFAWWKWSLFAGSIIMSLVCTIGAIVSYMMFRETYESIPSEDDETPRTPFAIHQNASIRGKGVRLGGDNVGGIGGGSSSGVGSRL